jgi:hypothetical protein
MYRHLSNIHIFIRILLLQVCVFVLNPAESWSQQKITVQTDPKCDYHAKSNSGSIYVFNLEGKWLEKCSQILTLCKAGKEIKIAGADVPDVSAVSTSGNLDYILINPDFLEGLGNDELAMGMITHALGHVMAHHMLPKTPQRGSEELEADGFMGFMLCKLSVTRDAAEKIPGSLTLLYGTPPEERSAEIRAGWIKADAALNGAPALSFYNSGDKKVDLNFRHFDLPPPNWSSRYEIPSINFSGCKTYADVNLRIKRALGNCGYTDPAYYQISKGFAMVTQLEQFNEDGSPKNEPQRWDAKRVRQEGFSITAYFKSLLFPNPGLFRVFAIIVTSTPFHASGTSIEKVEAMSWLQNGFNRPPESVEGQKYDDRTAVTVLVYEFNVSESTNKVTQIQPGSITGETHLRRTKIIESLRK